MFAHQVIEDLKEHYSKLSKEEKKDNYMIEVAYAEIIPNAIKFHFGDSDSILKISKDQTPIFTTREGAIKMPYRNMWFEFANSNDKYVKLAASVCRYGTEDGFNDCGNSNWGEQFELFGFVYLPILKKWRMIPQVVFFKDGYMSNYNKIKSPFPNGGDKYLHKIPNMLVFCATLVHKSVMLLNCKNIQPEKIKAPEALNKKRRRNGKQKIFDYHVLNVVVPSDKKRGYQEKSIPLSHNRVHLCRGHFKEYTTEHPLFGKYTGLYWWQPSVRGQNKDGIVIKDYNIKTA